MERKKYKVDGVDCWLKDLTLEEVETVTDFWNGLKVESPDTLSIRASHEKVVELFKTILEPCTPPADGKEINFKRATEATSMEIIKDFFLSRVAIGRTMRSYLPSSMTQPQEQLKSMKD